MNEISGSIACDTVYDPTRVAPFTGGAPTDALTGYLRPRTPDETPPGPEEPYLITRWRWTGREVSLVWTHTSNDPDLTPSSQADHGLSSRARARA